MHTFVALARATPRRLVALAVLLAVAAGRARESARRRSASATGARRASRRVLPSLYDVHPAARKAPRRRIGLRPVDLDRVVGTMRHPSQNTGDFLPLPRLRGQNWRGRWQRITRAVERLETLPSVELVQVGDDYYVVDGHNRIAAAKRAGAVEIDADVTQLLVPGMSRPGQATLGASSIVGAEEVRQAGMGRRSRTVEVRAATDDLSRHDLLGGDDRAP